MLPPIRLEDRNGRPYTLRGKGIVFGVCNFKIGGFVVSVSFADTGGGDRPLVFRYTLIVSIGIFHEHC